MATLTDMPRCDVRPPSDEVLARIQEGMEAHCCESNSVRYIAAVLAQSPSAECRLVGGLLVVSSDPVEHVWARIDGRDYDPTWHLLVTSHGRDAEYIELLDAPLEDDHGAPPSGEDGDWEAFSKGGLLPKVTKKAQSLGLISPVLSMR